MSFLSREICVVVTNYEFSDNASALKSQLSRFFPTVLIDASSSIRPAETDIVIENTYYPGLWNSAVSYCLSHNFRWLFFIASDVQLTDSELLAFLISEASDDDTIGIYTPSLKAGSRVSFADLLNRNSNSLRRTCTIEGFCFLARLDILKSIFPIDPRNKSGWGVDIKSSFQAHSQGKYVVVDDRLQIFHPQSRPEHQIDTNVAATESYHYLGPDTLEWYRNFQASLQNGDSSIHQSKSATLDLGCGHKPRNSFDADYAYGIDIVGNSLQRIRESDLNVSDIPFPDNFFDFITAYDFLEHVSRIVYCPNRRFSFIELMNEIYRVIRPGGVFLSVTPAVPHSYAFRDPTHVNFITEETFPLYFCRDNLWARMYGFTGDFQLLNQEWDDGKLRTAMKALK